MTTTIPIWRGRAVLALFGLLAVAPASAAAQSSVEVSPLRVELQAGPGSSTTQGVTLINQGKESVRVRATLTDWDLTRDGTPQFEGSEVGGRYSATAWVRIAPPEQLIEPGATATVRFNLAMPPDVQPGGYRTGILFEFEPASRTNVVRPEISFKSRIATLIYVNIGAPPIATELVDVRVRPGTAAVDVVATVKNAGRRTVRTRGTLVLFDAAGAVASESPVPDVPLLPESEREVTVPVKTSSTSGTTLPPGVYRAELRIDLGQPALIVGETSIQIAR